MGRKETSTARSMVLRQVPVLIHFMIYGEEAGYLTDNRPVLEGEDMFWKSDPPLLLIALRLVNTPIATLEDGMEIQKILNGIYESASFRKKKSSFRVTTKSGRTERL